MRVLAVDVGLKVCGYVVCEIDGVDPQLLFDGEIKPSFRYTLPKKLNYIFEALGRVISTYKVCVIVVEVLYAHHCHVTTLGLLAHVRGVVALLAQRAGVGFFEYAPTRARKSFLGKGSARSEQVKKMAENVTGRRFKSVHTADAFSLAVAFAHEQKVKKILNSINGYTD